MYQNIATKCLTGEVRLSYATLVEPKQQIVNGVPQGKPKYSVTLLIPKSDKATLDDLNNAFAAAAQAGLNTKFGGYMPKCEPLIHDGDGTRQDGRPFNAECKGMWVLTVSSYNKPQVVDISNIKVQLAPQDIYSGMWARVTVNFYPYNSGNNKGVGCGLGNVLKIRDDEPLAGGASAVADFEGIVPAAPVTAQRINPVTGLPM